MDKPHYFFYCDESGQFEYKKYKESIIFGMLVPSELKKELSEKFSMLKLKHNITEKFVHWKDRFQDKNYKLFLKELVNLTCESSVKLVCMSFDEDLLKTAGGVVSEAFLCNRYLYMIQGLIDNIMFYHPPLWYPEVDFTFRHNTRVFPVNSEYQKKKLEELGYKPNKDRKNQGKWYMNVWNTESFLIFLRRRLADFAPYVETVGLKNVVNAEMQVAKDSDDPFVHWVDSLAGLVKWKQNPSLSNKIAEKLEIEVFYGKEHSMYQNIVMTFLDKKYDDFLIEYFENISVFKKPYYHKQLTSLMERALDHLDFNSYQIVNLAGILEDQVEKSSGRWGMVLDLTDRLLNRLYEKGRGVNAETALSKLQGARLSCLNHRGEISEAKELAEQILKNPSLTTDDLRFKTEILNRLVVTGANSFDFISSAKQLKHYIKGLLESCRELSKAEGHELKDPLIGRLASTAGQAFAFAAPSDHSHFEAAETLLYSALKSCVSPDDTLRQSVYLCHLYLDMDRLEASSKQNFNGAGKENDSYNSASIEVRLLAKRPEVSDFLKNPAPGLPLSMAFVLAVLLKYKLQTGDNEIHDVFDWTEKYALSCFESCANEHPFELVWSYMGQNAFNSGNIDDAEMFFERALSIPVGINEAPPVIKAIHCQIMGLWAMCHFRKNIKKGKAVNKIKEIVNIMNSIAENSKNETFITVEGGGWFGPSVKALSDAIDKRDDLVKPLSCFLDMFTFNYR